MKKSIFAVCDLEASYAYNFMEYINRKRNIMYEVQAFTSVTSLTAYCEGNPVDLLLISNGAMCEEVHRLNIDKVLILSEGELLPGLIEYPTIYKYQSSDHIIREVMSYYADTVPSRETPVLLKKKMLILGVYSPIRRALKTSFAVTLGQVLAKEKNVLYISLEEYSGMRYLLGETDETDLADLMYFVNQGKVNVAFKLNGIVRRIQNLEYIPPVRIAEDLKGIPGEDWLQLIREIEQNTAYEVIILDFGETIQQLPKVLDACHRIFMPVRSDIISTAKLEQFEHMLKLLELTQLLEKIIKLKLPFHSGGREGENYFEQLVWGELGDYVRQLIQEENL